MAVHGAALTRFVFNPVCASRPFASAACATVGAGRTGLLRGCSIPALALGLALSGTSAFAGCIAVGSDYPCTGATDETLDAGAGNNLVYSGGASGTLTVNGQGGNDSIVFGLASSLAANTGTTVADGGDGDDLMTVQDASTLTGDILGGAGADNILLEDASKVTGTVGGGLGDDTLTLRDAGTMLIGTLSGGDGADVIMLRDTTTVQGDVDAGAGADKITLKLSATLQGDLLAGADIDTVLIRGTSLVEGDVDAGDGADILTIQERSLIEGSVYGGGGDDSVLLEGDSIGGSTIEGDFDAGAGNDTLRIRGVSSVLGDVLGGTGADALVVTGSSTVEGDVDGGADDDLVTVQEASVIKGSVLGGDGIDSLLVEGDATVEGALSGGDGNDLVTVTSGAVLGGISGGDGNDIANLSGGRIGGLSLDLGAGDDGLNLSFSDASGAVAIDLTGVLVFNGGTGANVATVSGFDASYAEGGLFDRSFDGWDSVTATGSRLQFSGDATVTALGITASSALFQTAGARALHAADGSDSAALSVDATSYIDMRDGAFAEVVSAANAPLFSVLAFSVLGPALPQSVADDSISVANLTLVGAADPLILPSLRVDFDADDTTYRSLRDDAVSGNADQIDAGSIATTGVIGIRIDAVGGYLDMGMPVGLSGSVAIIDDTQAEALARPGVGTTLVASARYVPVSDMPVDPARQWALVDQGNGGVYLQWTTVIDDSTVGPNGGAELAVAQGGREAASALLSGMAEGSIAKRPVCGDVATACAFAPVSVWMMAGNSTLDLGAVEGFAGYGTTARHLTGGVEYALGTAWNAGVFATLQQGGADLGSVAGAFGARASGADHTATFVGGYISGMQGGAYVSAMGAVGKASTELVNGALFGAASSHDSVIGVVAATVGKRLDVGNGFEIDPRVEASYAASNGDAYTDSEGLVVTSSAAQTRVSATVGVSYHREKSPLSVSLRAGTAFLLSDTAVGAGEAGIGSFIGTNGTRADKVLTASIAGSWTFNDRAALVGSISADRGHDLSAAQGGLTFTYSF